MRGPGLGAALLAAVLGAGPSLAAPPPRNVVLVTLDTTRADHLSCYGYGLRTSPRLDALAAQGVIFTQASAVVPLTGPGHATILTGLFPRDHGAIRNGVPMVEEVPTLATILKSRGMRAAAFVSGWTLRASLTGLQRGFQAYDDDMTDRYHMVNNMRPGDETVDRALAWLETHGDEPFFLWVHLFDAHAPYDDRGISLEPNPGGTRPPDSRKAVRAYDQEIAFADAQMGRLLDHLQARDLMDATLLVVTADHGESFGEHGENGHGRHLYETTQQVPLVLAHPSLGRGRVSDLPVSTLDITPTVLAALDLPPLPHSEGIDLGETLAAPGSFASRSIYMETYHGARKKFWRWFAPPLTGEPIRVAVRQGPWKAILNPKGGKIQLYDLAHDPAERQDLSNRESVRAGRFRPVLTAHAQREYKPESGEPVLSEEDRRRLESLGYVD